MKRFNPKLLKIGMPFLALILAIAASLWCVLPRDVSGLVPINGIGGPFSLIDHHGKAVTERDYLGKPTLVFFGFTYCPDVCPTTLFELSNRLKELGAYADRINALFITVDPERDTPQQLALYVASFDERITGLTGTPENIAAAMKAYRVYAKKIPLQDGGYTMDHTATVYMMDSAGRFVGIINHQEPDEITRVKLRRLIGIEKTS